MIIYINTRPGVAIKYAFSMVGWWCSRGEQYFTPKFITTFFCDISLISILSNKLLSHF